MSQNTQAVFALIPKLAQGTITGTTTDKTGATTTNLITIYTAGSNGSKVTSIGFKFQGTSTSGTFLIFISETNGTTLHLFDEIVVGAVTSSNTAATLKNSLAYPDLQLASGQKIVVGATTVNTSIESFATVGDF